MKDPST